MEYDGGCSSNISVRMVSISFAFALQIKKKFGTPLLDVDEIARVDLHATFQHQKKNKTCNSTQTNISF